MQVMRQDQSTLRDDAVANIVDTVAIEEDSTAAPSVRKRTSPPKGEKDMLAYAREWTI